MMLQDVLLPIVLSLVLQLSYTDEPDSLTVMSSLDTLLLSHNYF